MLYFLAGGADKRTGGGKRGDPSTAAEADLQWKTDVRIKVYAECLKVVLCNTTEFDTGLIPV